MAYQTIAIAGTFDHFHKGHKKFIREAFKWGERVVVGVTSDSFQNSKLKTQNSKVQFITQNFNTRKENLKEYLKKNDLFNRVEIVEIRDIYGPAIDSKSTIEALVVTRDTLKGARIVNRKRKELHLKPLKIIVISFELAEDHRRISSTRIRNGGLNRGGMIYRNFLKWNGSIPEKLRQKLKEPQGELIKGSPNSLMLTGKKMKLSLQNRGVLSLIIPPSLPTRQALGHPEVFYPLIISIGDEVTKLCSELKIPLSIAIVDFKINRKKIFSHIHELGLTGSEFEKIKVKNPAGTIKNTLVEQIYRSIRRYLIHGRKSVIQVLGEEDLAGLPAILLSPLGSIVLYGQPGEGIVVVYVTEELKEKLTKLMEEP